jgi:hypothetical protein
MKLRSLIVPAFLLAALPLHAAEPLPPGIPESYQNRCEKPAGPLDRQGTLRDEMSFLRLWAQQTYLWNKEIPDVKMADYHSAIDYFQALRTPLLTASGKPKDRYHYTYPQKQYEELQQGVSLGYGITWVRNNSLPRVWLIGYLEPGSAAAAAGLRRGDQLLGIDGVDFEYSTSSAAIGA